MFRTIRSRLWLSYAAVIAVMFGLVGAVLVIYLARNPAAYRQTVARLQAAETAILARAEFLDSASPAVLQRLAEVEGRVFDIRILVITNSGEIIADSRQGEAGAFTGLPTPLRRVAASTGPTAIVRDPSGQAWFYSLVPLNERSWLMLSAPRLRLRLLRALFSDELAVFLIRAGAAAVLLAFCLAWLMASWLSAPLKRLSHGVRAMEAGEYHTVQPEGPQELQELTASFNSMARSVRRSQQSQQDFTANVSHELKTPLTSIQGFAQAILDGVVSSPEAVQQATRVIYDESSRMYRMVLDLLTLARVEGGAQGLEIAPLDIPALLHRIIEKMAPAAEKAGVRFDLSLPSLPPISGDADRLEQVFSNLLDNALRFSPTGGVVRIDGLQIPGGVEITVSDEGPGIPPGSEERIFERFYQADPSRRSGSGRGTGLGLAIARQIVQAHRGTIQAANTGHGSRFTVHLPVSRQ